MPRIVFIGGGSLTWIPRFTHDLLRTPELAGSTVVLMDVDQKALDLMAPYVRRMIAEQGGDLEVLTSLDRDEAIDGADFVVSTFMAGGHNAWATDLNIAHRYGVQHPKGMSVGPGGFIQGLKAIPQLLSLAHAMERLCPDAPLFNYTNPMSSITLALQRHSRIKAIGVCPGITIAMQWFADFLGMERDDLAYRAAGVNHLNWVLEVRHRESGEDLLPQIVEKARVSDNPLAISAELYDLFGAFPTPGDDHTSECWPYYLRPGVDLSRYRLRHNFVENRMAQRARYRQEIEAALAGQAPVPGPRGESLEKLDHMITSILFDEKRIYDLNFMNRGAIENVMPEVVVEAPVQIGAHGFHPLHFGELPPAVAGWVNLLGTVQDLTVRAAVEGDRKLALQALLLDPMCYSLEVQQVRSMMDEMLEANKEWLPAFYASR
ncbi:MAG: hypothetical protein HPY83_11410 [Anaerolineae bacterium]|nr:hypothetical protein [Anaerolineae bacterium]